MSIWSKNAYFCPYLEKKKSTLRLVDGQNRQKMSMQLLNALLCTLRFKDNFLPTLELDYSGNIVELCLVENIYILHIVLHTSTVLGHDKDRLATVPYNVRFSSDKSFLRSHFASRYGTRLCNYHHSATCKIRDRAYDSL